MLCFFILNIKILNFLAHLYLSENYQKIMIGNFIADHIKGNQFTHLDPIIQKGIKLHREIDTFTDSHKITRMSKRRLHKRYGLFAGIVIDIFYDHYLAKNWSNYSAIPLKIYVNSFYDLVYSYQEVLPEKTLKMIPNMIKYDWLFNYQYKEGIKRLDFIFDVLSVRKSIYGDNKGSQGNLKYLGEFGKVKKTEDKKE